VTIRFSGDVAAKKRAVLVKLYALKGIPALEDPVLDAAREFKNAIQVLDALFLDVGNPVRTVKNCRHRRRNDNEMLLGDAGIFRWSRSRHRCRSRRKRGSIARQQGISRSQGTVDRHAGELASPGV